MNSGKTYNNSVGLVKGLADPFVFKHAGIYYLYGTNDENSSRGILAYESKDMVNWGKPAGVTDGYALDRDHAWGTKMFWSPEVIYRDGKFFMFYTAEETLAVATSDSPLGPFVQGDHGPLNPDVKQIDHKTLFDNGKAYIYFIRFDSANVIHVAELTDDLKRMKEDTVARLIAPEHPWEHTEDNPDPDWPVTEAPHVIKHKGYYYLFYTANHFRSQDYAVGYAVSKSPLGPFTKYEGNPILKSTEQLKGTGTTSIVEAPNGQLYMFYHAHCDPENVRPRKTCMDRMEFISAPSGGPDIVKVHGPTITDQRIAW